MDPQVIWCKGVNIISSMKCFIHSENTTLPKMFIQYSVTKSVFSEMTSKKSDTSGRQEQKCTFISTILISVFSFIILPHNYVHTMFYWRRYILAAFQSFLTDPFSFMDLNRYLNAEVWLSLMNQHPVRGLIVSKQNWAVKQQWEGTSVHNLRDGDPLCQPMYHILCFHCDGIQTTKETCLASNSIRMCKSVRDTEKIPHSFKGLFRIWNKAASH
jgi:hypothetical protein